MPIVSATEIRPALTRLSEEENAFRDAVAAFATEEVRPRVQEMERAGRIDPALIEQYFEMGLMGIEVPEQYGGAGGSLMMVDARGRGDQQGRRVRGDHARRAEHARELPDPTGTAATRRRRSTSRGSRATRSARTRSPSRRRAPTRSACATRAEQRGDSWVLNGRKMWITNGAEAGIFVVFANAESVGGLQGHHRVHRRARLPGLLASARRRTSSASARRARPS